MFVATLASDGPHIGMLPDILPVTMDRCFATIVEQVF